MAVKVGIGLFTGQVPPASDRTFNREYREVLEMARLAETLGFDSAWVSEHHGAGDGYLPSLLPMLAAVASATERMQLGTGVMLTPFHDPLRLAEDAAFVDQLSGGRLILGLGLGWREEEFRMFGQGVSERLRRTTETIEVLRRAWTGERFSFEGRHFRYERVLVTPRPFREGGVPIFIGGMTEAAIRRAGRIADGYIRTRSNPNTWRDALSLAEDGAREAGKDPAQLGYAQLQNAFVWDDAESGWQVVREGAAHQMGMYAAWDEGADTPEKGFVLKPPPEEALRHITPTGSPREIASLLRSQVEPFRDRTEFHLIVRLHYPGMEFDTASRAIELFGEQVLPALKGS
ncbi:MAG: LLM class flavin-dependent oxidoreductase [Actinomycetota bacterium]